MGLSLPPLCDTFNINFLMKSDSAIRQARRPHLVGEPATHDEGAHEAEPVPVRRHRHARPPTTAEAVHHAHAHAPAAAPGRRDAHSRRVASGTGGGRGAVGAVPPHAVDGGDAGRKRFRFILNSKLLTEKWCLLNDTIAEYILGANFIRHKLINHLTAQRL